MNNDHIEHSKHGSTSFVGADAVACFRAFAIASALRLYAQTGMKVNRAYTPSAMLKAATEITGKKYKRGEYMKAYHDVQHWAVEMRDALPHVERGISNARCPLHGAVVMPCILCAGGGS